jgi:putative acetyltransferase
VPGEFFLLNKAQSDGFGSARTMISGRFRLLPLPRSTSAYSALLPPTPLIEDEIAVDDPRAEDVRRLLDQHLRFAKSNTPPEDVHALEIAGLLDSGITFYSLRRGRELLAVGALKQLDAKHAELKSMHTAEPARGRGVGQAMLDYLIGEARKLGFRRLSLETGTMEAFAPARRLYARAGFKHCEPFGEYRESPNSCCMTLSLDDSTNR